MKRIYIFLLLLMASGSIYGQLLTENFSYTAGQLLTANGWTAHSGAGTNALTVTSPGLTYTGHPGSGIGNGVTMTTSGEDANKTFTAVTTGSVYMSFLVNVSAVQAGDYFTGLFQTASIFPVRIYAKTDAAGGFFFGVGKGSSTAVYETTSRTFNTTYLVVIKYTYNTGTTTDDVVDLWVNPALGGSETAATIPGVTGASTDATTVGAVFLRQGSAGTASTQQIDAILTGTTWGDVTPSNSTPTLSTTALTAFGNVCTNTVAGPNSFTISGSNLTTADVTVAALPGFTYSITAGGTYTTSLTLTQPGGTFSQQVFVKFSPVAVQSYSGNIVVGGGGASNVNAAASGAGINNAPSVTTGASSAVTANSATLAGTISATGCTTVTAYGIEWSLTTGFPNGSGTQVPSSNLAAGNFSSNLSGLASGTIHYYKAYATNGGGTTYGTEQNFTTSAVVPTLGATALTAFGNVCINTTPAPNSFTVSGTDLTAADVVVGPLAGFAFSTTAGGTYTASLTLTQPGGTYSQDVYVQFTPTAVQTYSGNIPVTGGGASAIDVAAAGDGVNTMATVATGAASAITTTTATLAGSISSNGCSAVTAYGIEYSTTPGFVNGSGTQVASSNLSGGNYTSDLSGLASNTTFYYKAYATNSGGTAYGSEQQFLTLALSPTLNATALAAFGNICINTPSAPVSFTINGSALTAANITVGPLAGYLFSPTFSGTYFSSISLTQPGGTYTQDVYVMLLPTAVQSYSGNIPVSGGGASAINVAADGAGINTAPSVTTGAASAITAISATTAGSIPGVGCSPVTAYGIEFSTTSGFPNGSGTQVASSNLSGGNFTSDLTGLTGNTPYYYKAYATNNGGTAYGLEQTFTTAQPAITSTALTAFGNVCTNTTAGPNSVTLTGTNLSAANVTVGPLAGFTFSTTAGGTYTASLTITQPGGAFSQSVFVKFTPVAVQSYNGNIPVAGGGLSATVNVAASGAGVNTAPAVTTGAATAVTQVSATAAGTITATGCTAVTAYGIEWSLTNGFPNGSGTQVASSNLSAGAFTSALSGLIPSTTYYYKAYATNGGGTTYGTQLSFTTSAPLLSTSALTAFGVSCINTTSGPNTFTITGTGLTTAALSVGPLAGYTFSETSGGTYVGTLSITQTGGNQSKTVYVKFTPTAVQAYNGNIPVSGGGAATVNVAASGSGVNTTATVTTGTVGLLNTFSATLAGGIATTGCSNVTSYGIEYSGINNFVNGSGTKVNGSNLTGSTFDVPVTGLVQGATYYYKAWAINNGGIAYGAQQSFTVPSIRDGFVLYPVPVQRGTSLRITKNNIQPGYYGLVFYNSEGKKVFQKDMHIQSTFINQSFIVPGSLGKGTYRVQLVNQTDILGTLSILVL